jgi:zinc transporter
MGEKNTGLLHACLLDGKGGGKLLDWQEVSSWTPEDGYLWLHFDFTEPAVTDWLRGEPGLDEISVEALVTDETRPRAVATHDALLLILRGVNLNPGQDPEDMVSVRAWITEDRAITLRRRPVVAVQDLLSATIAGDGPADSGDFMVELADRLTNRMAGVLGDIDDAADALEDEVLTAESHELRTRIGGVRRQAIGLRRYLAPQRDVMARLQMEKASWLDDLHRARLRELGDRVTRHVEDLDSVRDRAAVTQDELNTRLSDQMNRTMYLLSIVAAIFLPLGLITGLLGINVGGIPGTDHPAAFAIVCALLVLLAIGEIFFFKLRRWL